MTWTPRPRPLRAAITLAEQSDDPVSLSVAANALGSALLLGGDTEGEGWLRRSVHHAASQALDSEVARGYADLVSAAGRPASTGSARAPTARR